MIVKPYFNKLKDFYIRRERIILPLSFILGVIWDNLTLQRIDLLYENIVFVWNLFLVALVITLFNAYDAGRLRGRIPDKVIPFLPILLQFYFGNLFSGFIIFYFRSGSVLVSWPFFLLLLILFLGNEIFKKRYLRLTFQLSIFFIVLFSYLVFAFPIIFHQISALMFILSGLAALFIISLMVVLFLRLIPEKSKPNLKPIIISVGSIYILFQVLYFTNIIPPIPLSLKESGIYHSVETVSDRNYLYKATFEPASPYLFFKDQSDTFHWVPGSLVYGYSAVFSPTDLNATILHRWSYFNDEEGDWVEVSRIPFPIIGGRDGGYRGYSYTSNAKPGKWKLEVITERNQVLGQRSFKVVEVRELPELDTVYR